VAARARRRQHRQARVPESDNFPISATSRGQWLEF
jgi:hypothetical protein